MNFMNEWSHAKTVANAHDSKKPQTVEIKIDHRGETYSVRLRRGLGLQVLANRPNQPIEFDCRKSDCGICIVRVLKGMEHLTEPTEREKDFLRAMHADPEERLCCQARVFGDCHLKVDDFQ